MLSSRRGDGDGVGMEGETWPGALEGGTCLTSPSCRFSNLRRIIHT